MELTAIADPQRGKQRGGGLGEDWRQVDGAVLDGANGVVGAGSPSG